MTEAPEKLYRRLTIFNGGKKYLTRYYLLFKDRIKNERTDIPFNVFLHHFHESDSPVYHDHPFSYLTIILKGGYWEHKPDKNGNDVRTWKGPGSIVYSNKAKTMSVEGSITVPSNTHWVELKPGVETWTLFIRGRKQNDAKGRDDWGFYPDIRKPRVWHEDWLKGSQ